LAIISGDLFSDNHEDEELSELLEGKIGIPISTYFTVGNRVLPPRVIEKLSKNEDVGHWMAPDCSIRMVLNKSRFAIICTTSRNGASRRPPMASES
jgi:hypothetical protein